MQEINPAIVKRLSLLAILALLIAGILLYRDRQAPFVVPHIAAPAVSATKVILRKNEDGVEVFRRAFWRDPAPGDRIQHAERREWISEADGVRRWQWFLEVTPGPEFSRWLREENPFQLTQAPDSAEHSAISAAPHWFPSGKSAGSVVLQSASGAMQLIQLPRSSVLYATDSGHGFAESTKAPHPPEVSNK